MTLVEGKDSARSYPYLVRMTEREEVGEYSSDPVNINLNRLMEDCRYSQKEMERLAKVSQRHVSSIVNGHSSPTCTTVEKLVKPFDLPAWCLSVPDNPNNKLDFKALSAIVDTYKNGNKEQRDVIESAVRLAASIGNKTSPSGKQDNGGKSEGKAQGRRPLQRRSGRTGTDG